jgi:inner membrane transporter RhtA
MSQVVPSVSPGLARALPYLALVGSMMSFAAGTTLARELFPHVGATGALVYRAGFAAVLLAAVWRPWRRRWSRADLVIVTRYGLSVGFMNLCFYLSLRTIPQGIAIAIEFLGPLTIAVLESRRLSHFVWIGLAAVGLALLLPIRGGASLDPVGVACALGAAVCWALYIVFGKRSSHLPAGDTVSVGVAIAFLVLGPIGAATAGPALLDPRFMMLGLTVAIFSTALPYCLEMFALHHIPKRAFGVLMSAEPALGAAAGFVLLGETLTGLQVLAIALVIAAASGAVLSAERSPEGARLEQNASPEAPVAKKA